jgi:ribosomal protein S18 acetylase RimI-like enzyme
MDEPVIRDVAPDEIPAAADLVRAVFGRYVGSGYTDEGVRNFLTFVEPDAIARRLAERSFMLVAVLDGEIIGVVEVRDNSHVTLLFVREEHHRRGIARQLVAEALGRSMFARCCLDRLTVHSSPYAVPVYERLGFRRLGPEEVKDGIRYIPMARALI